MLPECIQLKLVHLKLNRLDVRMNAIYNCYCTRYTTVYRQYHLSNRFYCTN